MGTSFGFGRGRPSTSKTESGQILNALKNLVGERDALSVL
jgi:hypothetical protein